MAAAAMLKKPGDYISANYQPISMKFCTYTDLDMPNTKTRERGSDAILQDGRHRHVVNLLKAPSQQVIDRFLGNFVHRLIMTRCV